MDKKCKMGLWRMPECREMGNICEKSIDREGKEEYTDVNK